MRWDEISNKPNLATRGEVKDVRREIRELRYDVIVLGVLQVVWIVVLLYGAGVFS